MTKRFLAVIAASVLLLASAAAMAQPADPPGKDNAPGQQQEQAPGNSGEAPGQNQDDAPGNSGEAPGQNKDEAPGNSGDAPGQNKDEAPGNSGDVPGQNKDEAPGNSEAAHACQQDGYLTLAPAESPDEPFENTGDCVSYAAQGGELVDAEGVDSGTPEAEIPDEDEVGTPAASPEASPSASPMAQGNSDAAHACQQDGYLELARAESPDEPFENTGDCVSYAAQGGELVEFTGEAPATPIASPTGD